MLASFNKKPVWLTLVPLLLSASALAQPMKAIVYHEYGTADILHLEQTDKPVPKDNQVLIKVRPSIRSIGTTCAARHTSCASRAWE